MDLSLFIVSLAALVIPIIMARFKINAIPTAVAEIVTGIILGKSLLNTIKITSSVSLLSNLGVILLMFLSGMEINFDLFKKKDLPDTKQSSINPARIAVFSFAMITAMALILAEALKLIGLFSDVMLAMIIFMTVALGVVIATLKEKEILSRPIGQTILLTAVLGEVIPLLLLTIYASINGGNAGKLWLIILLFLVAILLLKRFKQPYQWFNRISKSTTQLDIRLAFFLIFTLVTVAERVGAENILGAFLAGMVMKLLEPSEATMDKLTSIGYGFFIPVLVLFLLLSKLPIFLVYVRSFNKRNSIAGTFLIMTTITIVLPTLEVARKLNAITETQSDAFILAAVVVCILGPILFNSIFKLTKEDKIKQRVVIMGTNVMTVPVAQELHDNWYDVLLVTHKQENYDTYKSKVANLKLISSLEETCLEKAGVFNCDILVAGFIEDELNRKIARMAKEHGVQRVIASQERPKPETIKNLTNEKIEIYNLFNVQTSVLRALIESPSILRILTDTKNGLFEVTVRNHKYAGQKLMNLDFIEQMTVSRIWRNGTWLVPHGNTIIETGDHLIFTAKGEDAERVREELGRKN